MLIQMSLWPDVVPDQEVFVKEMTKKPRPVVHVPHATSCHCPSCRRRRTS